MGAFLPPRNGTLFPSLSGCYASLMPARAGGVSYAVCVAPCGCVQGRHYRPASRSDTHVPDANWGGATYRGGSHCVVPRQTDKARRSHYAVPRQTDKTRAGEASFRKPRPRHLFRLARPNTLSRNSLGRTRSVERCGCVGFYWTTLNSMRRFCSRPAAVALSAMGVAEPSPTVSSRPASMPLLTK